jgi:hypothetical protein
MSIVTIVYPELSQELVRLGEEDQVEIRGHYQKLRALHSTQEKEQLTKELKEHCHARAQRVMDILQEIREPSISYIGREGSEMVSLLALHSYLDEMKTVLSAYQEVYDRNPQDVYNASIPSLTDRIMAFQTRKQLYGNNWMIDSSGNYFLIPVIDFEHMNERRAVFGLGPRMKPVVYASGENKHPLGIGKAEASDQKELTDEEYYEFTKYHLRNA